MKSIVHPEVSKNSVCLRGEYAEGDKWVRVLRFESKEAAEEYKNKVIEALRDWAENWEGWEEENVDKIDCDANIYEF